jgi:hypothetical protein
MLFEKSVSRFFFAIMLLTSLVCFDAMAGAQTASTGAMDGIVQDSSGAVIAGAKATVTNQSTGEKREATSAADGSFLVTRLAPGSYQVEVTAPGFKSSVNKGVQIVVTETLRLPVTMDLGAVNEVVQVTTAGSLAQVDETDLGRVVDQKTVVGLPLVTRNYTQVLGLSPGVVQSVNNAAELGRGGGGKALGNVYVGGSRSYDSNFLLDGMDINDYHSSSTGASVGTAVPNPDAIEQFKVQTGLFDASYGRNAGAVIDVITKSGSNKLHGSVFEFFRNTDLNATEFFWNMNKNQRRQDLKQNQFGFSLGGPVLKDKLLFFVSYQGTHQSQSYSAGGARSNCSATATVPSTLTNDRSYTGLGASFGGQTTSSASGSVAVAANGSNISLPAYNLLNEKLPNGSYLIPSPTSTGNVIVSGLTCTYREDQAPASLDYIKSDRNHFAARLFFAQSNQSVPFPIATLPGFPLTSTNNILVSSLTHTFIFSPNLVNEARGGYTHYLFDGTKAASAFSYGSIGVTAPVDAYSPYISVAGATASFIVGRTEPSATNQKIWSIGDSVTYSRGHQSLRFGGGFTLATSYLVKDEPQDTLSFTGFPEFLIGAAGTGSLQSMVASSTESSGVRDRYREMRDFYLYGQDDYKITPTLTINAGLRLEHFGHMFLAVKPGAQTMANFNYRLATADPGIAGSLAGIVMGSDYSGPLPSGVIKSPNLSATNDTGANNFGPRLGFAWQALPDDKLVLRGGGGLYYTHFITNALCCASNLPYVLAQTQGGATNNTTTSFTDPFAHPYFAVSSFPQFEPYAYNATTATGVTSGGLTLAPNTGTPYTFTGMDPNYKPAITSSFGLNAQTALNKSLLMEIGYLGKRATGLTFTRTTNQAALASAAAPIRGVTTNDSTSANLRARVPLAGFAPTGTSETESEAYSWYNALQASLTKRFSHGLQFLASYTWAKSLDSAFENEALGNSTAGTMPGNQLNQRANYGPSGFNRAHRFVISYVYSLPQLTHNTFVGEAINGWQLSGVTTVQSGQTLTILATNTSNAYGITADRAQLATPGLGYQSTTGCGNGRLFVNSGGVKSKLNNYFNKNCFAYTSAAQTTAAFPTIANLTPGKTGTDFGNSGVGIATGPGQFNFDSALMKTFPIPHWGDQTNVIFRAEAFNLFNHAQFGNPGNSITTNSTFGVISTTVVNPRVMQLALKINF